jgi:hypothetical protein
MDRQFITTSENPVVVIESVAGDLRLKGHTELGVYAKGSEAEDITLEQRGDEIVLTSHGDLSVRVPRKATVRVQAAHGDATFKALEGGLEIDAVHGDLTLRGVGSTHLNQVYGELSAKNVSGDLVIVAVDGDADVRDIQGSFTVSEIARGNLRLDNANCDASAIVNGNINLRLDPTAGQTYSFEAKGNIFCRLSDENSVEISVPKANKVTVNLPEVKSSGAIQTPYALTLGEGDAKLSLTANGNVVIDSHAPDWDMEDFDVKIGADMDRLGDEIGIQMEQQIEAQMRMLEANLNAQMTSLTSRLGAARLSEEQARRVEERARLASERASAQAQERMRRAQERMEQKLNAAQRKIEQKKRAAGRHSQWGGAIPPIPPIPPIPRVWSAPRAAPVPPTEPVSEEERLTILRMLEQKKISLDDAEKLLSALEGKEA